MGKLPQSGREHIVNPLPPIIDRDSRVLLLGSMLSPKSREIGFYFGNPQNRFWRVMAGLWGEKPLDSSEEKIRFCHLHHVAICDVLKACDIIGASDASIENPVPNDIASLLEQANIVQIYTLGGMATRLYHRHIEPTTHLTATSLPSTSPANARMTLDDLISAFTVVRKTAEAFR